MMRVCYSVTNFCVCIRLNMFFMVMAAPSHFKSHIRLSVSEGETWHSKLFIHSGHLSLKLLQRLWKETARVINITNTRKVSFSELVAQYLCDMTPAGEETYLQGNVLQQCVLQHSLQLPVNLQRQVQGQPAVRRVGGVKRSHDASPPTQVSFVNVWRLWWEGPRLLS